MTSDDAGKKKSIFHYENGVPIFDDQRINEIEHEQEDAKKRDAEYKGAQLTVNRRLAVFTGVLALCAIAGGAISGWQAHIANQTLTEIRNSKLDTAKIIEATQDQADAAGNIVDAANNFSDSAEAMSQTADKFAKSTEGIKTNTDSALAEFRRLAKATQDSVDITKNEQRAWVGMSRYEMIPPGPIKANVSYTIRPVIANDGRTPGFNIDYRFALETRPDDLPPTFQYFAQKGMSALMLPSQLMAGLDVTTPKFPDDFIKNLETGKEHIYIFGRVTYDDVFKSPHTTTTCAVYLPQYGTFATPGGECGAYNNAD